MSSGREPTSPARDVPITLGTDDTSELVTAGLGAMLDRHRDRVTFVPFDPSAVPDVILTDPYAGTGGDVRVRDLVGLGTGRVVVFSWSLDPLHVRRALAAGAAAYLPKTLSAEELVAAIEAVHRDAPEVGLPVPLELPADLTTREAEVLALVCRGLSNDEIATQLYLSINSIKTYIRQVYRKTGMSRRAQLVAWGLHRGF
ncbi:MAG: response regulator transcription factor [Nocardioides sp.]